MPGTQQILTIIIVVFALKLSSGYLILNQHTPWTAPSVGVVGKVFWAVESLCSPQPRPKQWDQALTYAIAEEP
jgi:hypothetical protein